MSDFETRFGGLARLYGQDALSRLRNAHVMVVGVGGVGSWTVEALTRSGVGALTLVDLDEVCISNVNRQLPALQDTVGQAKAEVLADRIRRINPECRVTPVLEFFTGDTADRILSDFALAGGRFVVDAIDSSTNKCQLILGCRRFRLPLVLCGAAGGRTDPTRVRITDLAQVTHDRLLSDVRKQLRREHGFPGDATPWNLPAVHSTETPVLPLPDGSVCEATKAPTTPGESPRLNCRDGYGSAVFVTGAFGFSMASCVVGHLVAGVSGVENLS